MYYTDINDEEVRQFHNSVKVNAKGADVSDALLVEDNRIFPLFYCDEIAINHELLRVLDNKMILDMTNDSDVLEYIRFNSVSDVSDFGIIHLFFKAYGNHYLAMYIYDRVTHFGLNAFEFTATHEDTLIGNFNTNSNGDCIIKLGDITNNILVTHDTVSVLVSDDYQLVLRQTGVDTVECTLIDSDGVGVAGESIEFYDSDVLLDTVVTDEDGVAGLTLSDGRYSLSCKWDSNVSNVLEIDVGGLELTVTGNSFNNSKGYLVTDSVATIDYGDDTVETATGNFKLNHTYNDGISEHTIKIWGVTSLGEACFMNCFGLESVTIPNSVTSIEGYCFYYCTSLTSILLNWNTANSILNYTSNWIEGTPNNLKFSIPQDTTSLYTAKGYPSDRLVERSD